MSNTSNSAPFVELTSVPALAIPNAPSRVLSSPTENGERSTVNHARERCSRSTSGGRRCRLRISDPRSHLCFRHLQLARRSQASPQDVSDAVLQGIDHLANADSINGFLHNVIRSFAHGRISRQDAIAFGYLAQLQLNTLNPLISEREEAAAAAQAAAICEQARQNAPNLERIRAERRAAWAKLNSQDATA